MYSVVLAAMLTAGSTMPAFGHGCHHCCGGYSGWSSSYSGYSCGCCWPSSCGSWSCGHSGYNCGCDWSSGCGNWSSSYGGVTVVPTYTDAAPVEPAQDREEERFRVRVIVVPSDTNPAGTAPQTPNFPSYTPGALDQPSAQPYTVPLTVPQMPTLPPLDQPSAPPSAVPLTAPQLPTLPQPQPQPPQAAASFRAIVVLNVPAGRGRPGQWPID